MACHCKNCGKPIDCDNGLYCFHCEQEITECAMFAKAMAESAQGNLINRGSIKE